MEGRIEDAVPVCEAICARSISDPRLQLDIRIHKFCELIYRAEVVRARGEAQYAKAVHEALLYAQQLASFALNAFPEAYEIFIDAMMLLALPKETASTHAIQKRRERIANQLVSLARFSVCARDSYLSFLIRYLLLIYVQFNTPCLPHGPKDNNTIDSLVSELLCCEPSKDISESLIAWRTDESRPRRLESLGAYSEADIQALRERASITRQESLESLAFANGNLFRAMKNELGRVMIKRGHIRRMVVEYCAARGLEEFHVDPDVTDEPYTQAFMPLSHDQTRIALPTYCVDTSCIDMHRNMKHVRELSERHPEEGVLERICEIESILGAACTDSLKFRMAQQKILFHLRRRNFEEAILISHAVLGPLAALHSELFPALMDTMFLLVFAKDDETVLSREGHSRKQSMVRFGPPESFQEQFVTRSNDEDNSSTPMSVEKPEPTPQNASYLEVIRGCNDRVSTDSSFVSMIEEAYVSFQKKYGEPSMVRLLKALLLAHQNWETQNIMSDQLAESFSIPTVLGHRREKPPSDNSGPLVKNYQSKPDGASTSGSGNDPRSQGPESREQTILVLMEFMDMSRAEAIAVLRNHPHAASTQSILDSLLGSLM
ncbi:hypothetical protein FGB62_58g119 [Gracilaria domingensis]|nr:hypothetical protein FGB62_58g119 [Gracilaria domingensis]